VLKALGVTPGGVRLSVVSSHGLLGTIATVLGIPLGIGLFLLVYQLAGGSADEAALPPWWQLALLVPATLLAVALASWPPATLASRIRVVDALRYE
jgi:putative ABC transport system permease protein